MKTLLLAAAASLALTAAMSGTAKADDLTNWTVTRTKTTTINEPTTIKKTETVTFTDTQPLNSEAAGQVTINSSVTGEASGAADGVDPLIGTINDPEIPTFVGDENNYDIHRSAT